ncbi:hypothetical protein [Indioceanicola profundi]|uniref:hypothetical protein n=1 Tax=Indioceanicola profundi TaxID=2220096 RepID=UPI0013C414F6|nr:hypothetical protein [Indioceanicola profundi]
MTVISFAKTTRRTSVAQALAERAKAKGAQAERDWVARIQDMVPNAELVPALASAAVMVLCLSQIF